MHQLRHVPEGVFCRCHAAGDETVYVKEENCVGCGGCLSVCPVTGTIEMKQV
ncbi:MAG: 4Fe-4S binding protein [Desulfotignum sp.]|nr:4Fe-4S binding protein [Desulfotignum sp.]